MPTPAQGMAEYKNNGTPTLKLNTVDIRAPQPPHQVTCRDTYLIPARLSI